MKQLTVCGVLFLAACAAPAGITVEHFGVMREVMMEGKTEARVALADYEKPGFYGVGAVAGLQGEIMIFDGKVMIARDWATHLRMEAGAERATLLTVARVSEWREVPLADGADLEAIGRTIAAEVPESMMAGAAPVPFRIAGLSDHLAMHIVRGACPHGVTTPETEPDRWSGDHAVCLTVVGFFAPGRAGVMTHHGTAIHAHAHFQEAVVSPSSSLPYFSGMGHVDSLVCGPGTKLFVPAR